MTSLTLNLSDRLLNGLIDVLELSHQAKASIQDYSTPAFDPQQKLTHEALFALPLSQRLAYYKAQGGWLSVSATHGTLVSEDAASDILVYIEKQP